MVFDFIDLLKFEDEKKARTHFVICNLGKCEIKTPFNNIDIIDESSPCRAHFKYSCNTEYLCSTITINHVLKNVILFFIKVKQSNFKPRLS